MFQYIVGRYYGYILLKNEDDTVQVQKGCSPPYKEKYESVEKAKETIRSWKGKTLCQKKE